MPLSTVVETDVRAARNAGFIDDINGFDFAGSGDACQGDWRARAAPPPPSPSPPPPPPPSPPPPSRRPPPPKRAATAKKKVQAAALTSPTVRATYATQVRTAPYTSHDTATGYPCRARQFVP